MAREDELTRDDLLAWQNRACQVVMNVILSSYKVRGFHDVAPIPMDELEGGLMDFLADITMNAWNELDPDKWMNEPNDGTRSDDLHDGRYVR
jgi:hypothetical protein